MPRKKTMHEQPAEYDADEDSVITRMESDETFHIGQTYEEQAATTLSCKKCGSKKFFVGQGNYFTAIKCPKCGWEVCIHDG